MADVSSAPSQVAGKLTLAVILACVAGCEPAEYVLGTSNQATQFDAAAVLGPFGPPELVSELSESAADASTTDGGTPDANNPTFTADLLELYFTTGREGGLGSQDIWVSRRASPSDRWGAPAPVPELNSADTETSPGISADGLTIWLESNRPGGKGAYDVWMSTRPNRNSAWTTPVNVPELSSTDDDMAHPTMYSPLLILVATRSLAPPEWDLLWATRPDQASPFGTPTPITELNSSSSDVDPYLSADGLEFFFNSNRVPDNGEDLYYATRTSTAGKFSEPRPITELNGTSKERDPWLSPDLRYITFSSNRSGTYLIYQASR
jgi:Tol biopolymer transport system component